MTQINKQLILVQFKGIASRMLLLMLDLFFIKIANLFLEDIVISKTLSILALYRIIEGIDFGLSYSIRISKIKSQHLDSEIIGFHNFIILVTLLIASIVSADILWILFGVILVFTVEKKATLLAENELFSLGMRELVPKFLLLLTVFYIDVNYSLLIFALSTLFLFWTRKPKIKLNFSLFRSLSNGSSYMALNFLAILLLSFDIYYLDSLGSYGASQELGIMARIFGILMLGVNVLLTPIFNEISFDGYLSFDVLKSMFRVVIPVFLATALLAMSNKLVFNFYVEVVSVNFLKNWILFAVLTFFQVVNISLSVILNSLELITKQLPYVVIAILAKLSVTLSAVSLTSLICSSILAVFFLVIVKLILVKRYVKFA